MSLPKINYAKKGDSVVCVDEVANGLACNCVCLKCGHSLVAKNKGKLKEHHFAHYNAKECKYAYETMIHELAKEIILENLNILKLPKNNRYFSEVCRHVDASTIYTDFVFGIDEANLGNIIPDILLKDRNDKTLLIEIKVTHKVDDEKREKIAKRNLCCLEIDLSDLKRTITKEELKEYIKFLPKVKWVNFYINENEKKKILDEFIKNDKYEMIPQKAIKLYTSEFCGTKERHCDRCSYSSRYHVPDKVLCKYKVSKYMKESEGDFFVVARDNEYFITNIKYTKNNTEQVLHFKTFDEIDNEWLITKEKTIYLGHIKYVKGDTCGSIENLWKQKNRSSIIVMNNENEVFKIYKSSYKLRTKNKYIQAIKLRHSQNVLDMIYDYNKKVWHELIRQYE